MSPQELESELECIDALAAEVRALPRGKRQQLVELARTFDDPALVFTSAIATAHDLRDALRDAGVRVAVAASRGAPLAAIAAFRRGDANVLVATDLAAEGLNLQRAGVVVHYDIPWNPMKLEQRNGRAQRLGQRRAAVRAFYFVPNGDLTRVMHIVAAKNRARRRTFAEDAACEHVDDLLPPRLPRDAAALALIDAARAHRIRVDEAKIARRHRAGIELLMRELATEHLDERRIDELLALIAREP